jgi:hypothetical protein
MTQPEESNASVVPSSRAAQVGTTTTIGMMFMVLFLFMAGGRWTDIHDRYRLLKKLPVILKCSVMHPDLAGSEIICELESGPVTNSRSGKKSFQPCSNEYFQNFHL